MFNKFKKLVHQQDKSTVIGHFQDLEHIDGVSISTVSAELYKNSRDALVMFYFISINNFNWFISKEWNTDCRICKPT